MRSFAVVALVAILATVAVSGQATGSTGGPGPVVATTPCDIITQYFVKNAVLTNPAHETTGLTLFIASAAMNSTGSRTVPSGFFIDPQLRPYFNGALNYRSGPVAQPFAGVNPRAPDYTVAGTSQTSLVEHLVRFFTTPLQCSAAAGMQPYVSTVPGFGPFNQYQVHANMNITAPIFTSFNNYILQAAATAGVPSAGQTIIQNYLSSFGRDNTKATKDTQICWTEQCPCAYGITGANCDNANSAATASVSFVTMLVAALLAVVAMRR